MANLKETYTAANQLDYRHDSSISKADAHKGVAVTYAGAAEAGANRPQVKKSAAAGDIIVGGLTSVGDKNGCNVVKTGRFILQAASAWQATDFGKTVVATATPGKVEAADRTKTIALSASSDFASDVDVPTVPQGLNGHITIVGDATNAIEGIGPAYLCEYC